MFDSRASRSFPFPLRENISKVKSLELVDVINIRVDESKLNLGK